MTLLMEHLGPQGDPLLQGWPGVQGPHGQALQSAAIAFPLQGSSGTGSGHGWGIQSQWYGSSPHGGQGSGGWQVPVGQQPGQTKWSKRKYFNIEWSSSVVAMNRMLMSWSTIKFLWDGTKTKHVQINLFVTCTKRSMKQISKLKNECGFIAHTPWAYYNKYVPWSKGRRS